MNKTKMKGLAFLCGLYDYPKLFVPRIHVRRIIEAFLKDNNQLDSFQTLLTKLREIEATKNEL